MSDIAREAGVSIATVGRVIHNNGYVSIDARKRVEAAVERLGYVPNTMARALKKQKSGIIGSFVVYNQNNLYQKINNSVIKAAEVNGYKIVTIGGRLDHDDEEDIINQFIGMQVDGLVITSNKNMPSKLFDKLHSLSIPVVAIERTYDHPYVDNIVVKDVEGTYSAAEAFIKKGHKAVALIASQGTHPVEVYRLRGFKQAMTDAGLALNLIKQAEQYSVQGGYDAMKELLAAETKPTGVVCTADTLAAGAMQALYEAGLRVPEDMSITGYDNELAAQLAPPISSVDLAVGQIGEKLFSLLDRRMNQIDCAGKAEYLDTVFVDRNSIRKR